MKTKIQNLIRCARYALLLATLNPQLSTFAQGSLTPPGAPAPTMKSLTQVEPRTPISSAPYTISSPGSYYLATNLTVSSGSAITVATNDVTVDLGGFTVKSTAAGATGYGILINSGLRNLAIVNGFIEGGVTNNGSGVYTGSGFAYGISYSATAPVNVRVSAVSVSGCLNHGINLFQNATVVQSCTVQTVGSYGIVADAVSDSTARDCGQTAISANTANHCSGESQGGVGVSARTADNCYGSSASSYGVWGSTANDCVGFSAGSSVGLYADYAANNCYGYSTNSTGLSTHTATGCYGYSVNNTGVDAYTASGCYGQSGSGSGIWAYCAHNCYGQSSSGYGLRADYSVENCYGHSGTNAGLYANYAALNCYGWSDGSGYGLFANVTALNCYGRSGSGVGLWTSTAQNCYGSGADTGLYAYNTAQNCYGYGSSTGLHAQTALNCQGQADGSSPTVVAVNAYMANSCYGYSFYGTGVKATYGNFCFGTTITGTAVSVTYKYNMP